VEREKLSQIVEAGRYAPTGSNRQACRYVVVSGREVLDRMVRLAMQVLGEQAGRIKEALDRHHRLKEPLPEWVLPRQHFPAVWERIVGQWKKGVDTLLYQAPAAMIIHMEKSIASVPEVDASMAAMQMVLMAETLGLGTCYIGFLVRSIADSEELRKMLEIPRNHRALVAFTVGYPDVKYLRLVHRNPAKTAWIGEFKE